MDPNRVKMWEQKIDQILSVAAQSRDGMPAWTDLMSKKALGFQEFCKTVASAVNVRGRSVAYEAFLESMPYMDEEKLDLVLVLGNEPTSRPMKEYLALAMALDLPKLSDGH